MSKAEIKLEDGHVVGRADVLRWMDQAANVLSRVTSRRGNRPKAGEVQEAKEGLEWARVWVINREE